MLRRNGHRRADGEAFAGAAIVKSGVQFPDAGRFGGGRAGLVKIDVGDKDAAPSVKIPGQKGGLGAVAHLPAGRPRFVIDGAQRHRIGVNGHIFPVHQAKGYPVVAHGQVGVGNYQADRRAARRLRQHIVRRRRSGAGDAGDDGQRQSHYP